MPDIISLNSVNKIYKDFWGRRKVVAVENLSFSVRQGEVFGLLGPNGSGKTTSLKMMLGLVFPSKGTIWVFERKPNDLAVKKRIGFLPEESYLYRFLTAEESLRFYSTFFDIEKPEERIRDLLHRVGLYEVRNRRVHEFSKGMSRRLGIAQALINDPDLLMFDEPTSGLDPMGCREVKDLIVSLREQGKTILLCSHLLADVEDVCDRIAILHQGRLQIQGTMQELLVQSERMKLICEGVSEGQLKEYAKQIESEGATVVGIERDRKRLEELFIATIKNHDRA